jgi:hypothetical protein
MPASAAVIYDIDENCNGSSSAGPLNCSLWLEPASGLTTIRYDLPASLIGGLVPGDYRLIEDPSSIALSDVLRFNADMHAVFVFSDNDGGADALADVGLPLSIPGFQDFERELSPGVFGYSYTPPNANYPGWIDGGVTYNFISDTPEPGTVLMMALPLAGLLLRRRSSKV